MKLRLSALAASAVLVGALVASVLTVPAASAATTSPRSSASTQAAPSGWTVVSKPIVPHTLHVTVALVAPQGTTPSFSTADARQAVEAASTFFSRETDGALKIQIDQIHDWMNVDQDWPCSWAGAFEDWVKPRIGWQGGAGKHLVVMVPPGDPCPDWANGDQNWAIDAGGSTYQPGTDPYMLAHELGHNMSMFHASSIGCNDAWDFSTLGADIPENCWRTEYGNRLDVMGSAWTFNPYPAPTLDRIGMLPKRYEPACGSVRTLNITSVGAAANNREAISFADPRDPNARYWIDFRAQADANIYNYLHGTWAAFKPNRDGLQIMRNDPTEWAAPTVLSRPNDGDDHRQITNVNERVTLGGGSWVEYKGNATNGEAIVDVFVPCKGFESTIVAQHSNLCLDNADWSSANGNIQTQYGCSGAAVQNYAFIKVAGASNTYTIVNRHSGKCLDIAQSSKSNGAAVQQWTCSGSKSQQFTLRKVTYAGAGAKDYQIVSRNSSKCVDVEAVSTDPGARVHQWTCIPANQASPLNQTWRIGAS